MSDHRADRATPVAAIDLSCGGLVVATHNEVVGMTQAVALTRDVEPANPGRTARGHRVWCGPEVDDLAREGANGVVDEPWALVDAPRVVVGGIALPFPEVGGAGFHRARRWLGERFVPESAETRLVIPSNWGAARRARARLAAAEVGLRTTSVRAALLMADALESSSVRWAYTVELTAKGAVVSLVHRERRTLSLVDTAFVLRTDPDDDDPDSFERRVQAAIGATRERHRSARSGSHEVLVRGRGAAALVDALDASGTMLGFRVPAGAVAEAAVGLPRGTAPRTVVGSGNREPPS